MGFPAQKGKMSKSAGRKMEKAGRLSSSRRNRSGSKSQVHAVSCYTRPRSRTRTRTRFRSRSRSRSASPSAALRKQRPTRSTSKRRRRGVPSLWDVPPKGYAHVTPMQYKAMQASGQISARIQSDAQATADTAAIASVTRQARRLYVGNIPFGVTEEDIIAFFNQQFLLRGDDGRSGQVVLDGKSVLSCSANLEKNFAFVEFRSMQEATRATSFDGSSFRGQVLKIRRPHDYHAGPCHNSDAASGGSGAPSAPSVAVKVGQPNSVETVTLGGCQAISNLVPDSPHKIYMGGLPTCLNETQIKELLLSFGQLRGFNLIKDQGTALSKGYAFFEYLDPTLTEQVIANLNGMQLGDRRLIVQRSIPSSRYSGSQQVPIQVPGLAATSFTAATAVLNSATQVLCLLNMVLPEELLDNEEYEDIRTDIEQECSKYGEVLSLKIPRPRGGGGKGDGNGGGNTRPKGCGKVYVHFGSIEDSERALGALSGRKFSGRIVIGSFFDCDKYLAEDF